VFAVESPAQTMALMRRPAAPWTAFPGSSARAWPIPVRRLAP